MQTKQENELQIKNDIGTAGYARTVGEDGKSYRTGISSLVSGAIGGDIEGLENDVEALQTAVETNTENIEANAEQITNVKEDLIALEQEGYPMASITEAVDAWADEHQYEIVNVYVTPEMFGAKGDGVTDDTEAVTQALTYKNVIGVGTYAISSPIYAQISRDSGISLNLKAISIMEYMLWLDAKGSAWSDLVEGHISITLDCNLLSNNGLRIDRFHGANVKAIVKNFTGNAVTVRYTNNLACGANHINVFATNLETADTVSENATALKSGQDDIYYVSCANVKTAVNLAHGGNQFINLHAWSSSEDWFEKSVMLEINTDSENQIDELVCDTIQILFKLDNSGNARYPKLHVDRLVVYNNTVVTSLPIYIWWLKTTNVFYPKFDGLSLDITDFKNAISWSAGTVPNILVGDTATVTDVKDVIPLCLYVSVIKLKNMTVTGLNYIFNCEKGFYNFGGVDCVIDAMFNGTLAEQHLRAYRASAHRMRPNNMNGWLHPWVDNSFNQRTFNRQVPFVSGTTTYEIVKISDINGLTGTAIATVMGTFAGVTSQPKIYPSGEAVYVQVDSTWLASNAGNHTFYGMVLTNGAIS